MPSNLYSATNQTMKEFPTSILVHGTFGSRKTTSAMSLSRHYPALPAQAPFEPPVNLKDGLILGWDRQPTLGFAKLGISCPVLNLNEVPSPLLLDALSQLYTDVATRVKEGTEFIVHDTISAFNNKIVSYCTNLFDRKKDGGFQAKEAKEQDTASQALYRAVLEVWSQYFQRFSTLKTPEGRPIVNVFNAHSEVKGEVRAGAGNARGQLIAQEQNQAKGIGDTPLLAAEITGKAWGEFHRQCPLIMYIEVGTGPGGKQEARYYTKSGYKNALARDRSGLLADSEPADFRALKEKFR